MQKLYGLHPAASQRNTPIIQIGYIYQKTVKTETVLYDNLFTEKGNR